MRKFSHKDVRNWKVADINGKAIAFTTRNKEGEKVTITSFDGYRSASNAAKRSGFGTPVRE